jgi:hypothetical protein
MFIIFDAAFEPSCEALSRAKPILNSLMAIKRNQAFLEFSRHVQLSMAFL